MRLSRMFSELAQLVKENATFDLHTGPALL